MADVTLQVHYITSGLGGGGNYLTGQYIRVIADGAAIRAELWTDATSGTYIDNPSGGPDLTGEVGQITVSSGTFNDYQYCSGDDLIYYTVGTTWPYATYHLSVDHPSCAIVVCDLEITSTTETNETAVGAADGEVAIVATSSNGTIKYGVNDPDFDYATGLTSPITGLSTGNYIIYAKDAANCTDSINIFIGIDFTYGVRWRCDYDNVRTGFSTRIDIEERDYVGAVEETCSGETPFTLEYIPKDGSQVVPSVGVLQFLVERGQEHKFDDIRTGYDRKHVAKVYKDYGSGWVIFWVGYITPEFYTEPYYHEPYHITLKAIDGLGEMNQKAFIELSGEEYYGDMSLLDIITEILKKLPVSLNLRSCLNIFEDAMDTAATDDPLPQTFIASENYRDQKCEDVLNSILKPFVNAEIFQSYGYWWIRTKEQSVDTTLAYREFDGDGVYVTNSTLATRKDLDFPSITNRFAWKDRSQVLSYTRNYGTFRIIHDLDKDNNIIDSGGFEVDDIDPSTEFFRDWQIYPAQTNVTSGIEYTDSQNSKGSFFFQWANNSDDAANNILATAEFPVHVIGNVFEKKNTNFHLYFKVLASPRFNVEWVWFGWKLRFTDTDTGDFYDWEPPNPDYVPLDVPPVANEARINDIYISSFNTFNNYEFKGFRLPGDIDAINFTVQLLFYFHNHKGRDFASFALLRDVVTVGMDEGKRYYVAEAGTGAGDTYGYELQATTDAESAPDIIRPDDYNATTNPVQWVLIAHYNADGDVPMLGKILIDDVKIKMYDIADPVDNPPWFNLIDPPETVVYEETVSTLNESVFEETVTAGDVPDLTCFEYIYNGYFKLSDGSRTSAWGRSGVTESRYLLDIYLGHLVAQGQQSLRVLSGTGIADIQLGYINSLKDNIDDVKYRFTRFLFEDKNGFYDVEMEETITGADGESPPDPESITFDSTVYIFDDTTVTFDNG